MLTAFFRSPQAAFSPVKSSFFLKLSHADLSFFSIFSSQPTLSPASWAAASVSWNGLLIPPPLTAPPPPPPPAASVAFRIFNVSKDAVCKASFCFFAAPALLFCASVRSSTASVVSEIPAEIPLHFHSFPATEPPKTLAMACATLLAMVAIPAKALPTAFKIGRKTVPMVRTAWPNFSLTSPRALLSCCMRPLGVDAKAAFMPPTRCLTISARVAARSSSEPYFIICC